ncbi:hypothetical protein CCR75_003010 [Bremia lactucae]|uniref:RNase H type-1 domain-containing protein n=1 Tax=Bremia lactucae TaxID=4779 RepID=A0A976IBR4_BRELC|nr:hypothetical protein CCR75_003010 [Bremia lactucae]
MRLNCREIFRPLYRCFTKTRKSPFIHLDDAPTAWPDVLAYADGASRGNPGRSGCGALLLDPCTGQVLASESKFVGNLETNNVAEYHGLILVLQLAQRHRATHVRVHMDSQLIVRQMLGQYRVKAAHLRSLHHQCKKLTAAFPYVSFFHVTRDDNAAADRLANEAIDAHAAFISSDK